MERNVLCSTALTLTLIFTFSTNFRVSAFGGPYWQNQRNPFETDVAPYAAPNEHPVNHADNDLALLARLRGSQSISQPFQLSPLISSLPNPAAAIDAETDRQQRRPSALELAGRFGVGGGEITGPPRQDGRPPFEMVERDLARLAAQRGSPENQKFGPTADIIQAAHILPANDVPVTSPNTENSNAPPYLYNVFDSIGQLHAKRNRLRARSNPRSNPFLAGRANAGNNPWFHNKYDFNREREFDQRRNYYMLQQRSRFPMPYAPQSPMQPGLQQILLAGRGSPGIGGAQAYGQQNSIAPISGNVPVPDLYRNRGFGGGGGAGGYFPDIYSGVHEQAAVFPLNYGYGGKNNIDLSEYGGPDKIHSGYNDGKNYNTNTYNKKSSAQKTYGNNNINNHGTKYNNTNSSYNSRQIDLFIQGKDNKNKVVARQANVYNRKSNFSDHSEGNNKTSVVSHRTLNLPNKRHHVSKVHSEKINRRFKSRYNTIIARLDRTVRRRSLTGGPKIAFDTQRYNFRDVLCPAFSNDLVGTVRASVVDKGKRVKTGETYLLRYSLPNYQGELKVDPISGDVTVVGHKTIGRKDDRFNLKFGDPPVVLTVLASLNKLSGEKFAQIFVPVAQATAKIVVECL